MLVAFVSSNHRAIIMAQRLGAVYIVVAVVLFRICFTGDIFEMVAGSGAVPYIPSLVLCNWGLIYVLIGELSGCV